VPSSRSIRWRFTSGPSAASTLYSTVSRTLLAGGCSRSRPAELSTAGSSIFVFEPSSGISVAVAMNQSPLTHASSHFALLGELLGIMHR